MSLENKALHRAEILIKLIKENEYKNIAEVGVKDGETAMKLVANCRPDLYIAVDIMQNDALKQGMEERKEECFEYKIMTSLEAAKEVPDKSLDLVFIDALHDHRSVLDDIKAWLPKIRKGGMITGHDYCDERYSGVVNAVDEMFPNVEKELDDFDVYVWYKKI